MTLKTLFSVKKSLKMDIVSVSFRVLARVRAGLYRRSHAYARLYIDGPAVPSKCTWDIPRLATVVGGRMGCVAGRSKGCVLGSVVRFPGADYGRYTRNLRWEFLFVLLITTTIATHTILFCLAHVELTAYMTYLNLIWHHFPAIIIRAVMHHLSQRLLTSSVTLIVIF